MPGHHGAWRAETGGRCSICRIRYPRHCDDEGQQAYERKTRALLQYAPPGSYVVRIGHAQGELRCQPHSLDVTVDNWRAGETKSMTEALAQIIRAVLSSFKDIMRADVCQRLQSVESARLLSIFNGACDFARVANRTSNIDTRQADIREFLEAELYFSSVRMEALAARFPQLWRCSIEGKLKPLMAWFEDVELGRPQAAKVIARSPNILGYSIEGNLKPKVAWMEDVGLSRPQVAKVISRYPQVLGLSIEDNLKPKVAWMEDVGISRPQVAKVVSRFPQVLSLSIESNLKPTVAWTESVGLNRLQVAEAIARCPSLLGFNVGANLSMKHLLLQDFFTSDEICDMIIYNPTLLTYSLARLDHRVHVLQRHDQLAKLPSVMSLTDSRFVRRFEP